MPDGSPNVWLAKRDEARDVARLLVAFRDHLDQDWPPEEAMLASVERLLDDPDTEYLLAAGAPGQRPTGLVQLRYRWSVWRDSEDCLLEDLFVDRAARRNGLGRALVEAAVERARVRGCRRIELDTAEVNEAALALYFAMGFDNDAYEGGRALFLRRRLDR